MTETHRIKILVDAVFFQLANTGIARVWISLLKQWSTTAFSDQIVVLDRAGTAPQFPGIRYIRIPPYNYADTAADKQMLQDVCDDEDATLFVSSYYTTPLTTPSIFMAYDMIPEISEWDLTHPEWAEKQHAIRHARHYISISQNTANDLGHFFPDITPERVSISHCGTNFLHSNTSRVAAFKAKHRIDRPYWLLVGRRDGYKNGKLFFEAFSLFGNRRKDFSIVCTGRRSSLEPEYAAHTGEAQVLLLDLSEEELQDAYSGAQALVYPSLYEGFGMPIIEAMACGCPVITSPCGSIPEVAGNAALFVNPWDIQGMHRSLERICEPLVRLDLIKKGTERCRLFDWAKMAEETKNALLHAAQIQTLSAAEKI